MNRCAQCGAALSVIRCPFCGSNDVVAQPRQTIEVGQGAQPFGAAPAAPTLAAAPKQNHTTWIIAICIITIAAGLGIAFALGAFDRPANRAVPPAPTPAGTPAATTPPSTPPPTAIVQPAQPQPQQPVQPAQPTYIHNPGPPGETVTDPAQAYTALSSLADQGRNSVSFDGRWVAQLASKYEGVTDPQLRSANGTNTFGFPDILTEHMMLRRSTTDAQVILLRSTDYGKRTVINGQPIWVTMALRNDFTSEAAVKSWCARHYPAVSGKDLTNICMPNRLRP